MRPSAGQNTQSIPRMHRNIQQARRTSGYLPEPTSIFLVDPKGGPVESAWCNRFGAIVLQMCCA
eukprot:801184-Pyramimonas_sp.AAC.1